MKFWYTHSKLALLLLPLTWIYLFIIACRKWCYDEGWLRKHRSKATVIVVGNLTVGGEGKTPVVIELAKQLTNMGYRLGIVSRGYGGRAPKYPLIVSSAVDVNHCGDEPMLIAQKTNCPVVVDPNRPRGAQYLLKHFNCNVILSDDGLQHYALDRDIEIVIQDPLRGYGNHYCLPAGPLREPISRLATVDYVLTHLDIIIDRLYSLNDPEKIGNLRDFVKVHAMAGIGHPEKFFTLLRENGVEVVEHPKADHYRYKASDFEFDEELPIIITEKDAVKCREFADKNIWVLAIKIELPEKLYLGLAKQIGSS